MRIHLSDSFQFHKGTIKTHPLQAVNKVFGNFNSIKVRLKQVYGVTE